MEKINKIKLLEFFKNGWCFRDEFNGFYLDLYLEKNTITINVHTSGIWLGNELVADRETLMYYSYNELIKLIENESKK